MDIIQYTVTTDSGDIVAEAHGYHIDEHNNLNLYLLYPVEEELHPFPVVIFNSWKHFEAELLMEDTNEPETKDSTQNKQLVNE